jgi:biopolymer transport protein ExbD
MIDMTFLLLIFFMVASTISPFAQLQLPEARSGGAEKTEGRVALALEFRDAGLFDPTTAFVGAPVVTLADCRMYFEDAPDQEISPQQLPDELATKFAASSTRFTLQANRKMPVGVIREVMRLALAAGATDSMVAVTRPK